MEYCAVKALEETGLVKAFYTTIGHGCWLSNNPEGWENYRQVAKDLGLQENDLTGTFQRHTDHVAAVNRKEHGGRYVFYRTDPIEVADGIVTNEKGFLLTSMESDCPPVFLLDPVKKAIGMVHSGWKGTASGISVNAVRKMRENYGSQCRDILVAYGPCICADCYEVGADLLEPFSANYSAQERESFFLPRRNGKYSLDIKRAITVSLQREGIAESHIFDCGECTFHSGRFYSHRLQIKRGEPGTDNMLTGIMLVSDGNG